MNLKRNLILNTFTPLEVILSAFKCCNIILPRDTLQEKKQKRIEFYNKYNHFFQVKPDYDKKDLEIIASYTSYNDVNWKKQPLLEAFNHVLDFEKNIDKYITDQFTHGSKNNDAIHNYDIIMVYQICQHLALQTTEESTLDTMTEDIKTYLNQSKQSIYNDISSKLSTYTQSELIQVNKQLKKHQRPNQELTPIADTELLTRTLLTNEECVVYAAKYFWYDISESAFPHDELMHIHHCKQNERCYKPVDKSFLVNYTKNKYYYQLDYFWKPQFKAFYSSKCISNLLKHESLELDDSDLHIRYLDDIIKHNNFYIGVFPRTHQTETYIYKNDINYNDILISYGTYDQNVVVTIEELNKFFSSHNEFMELLDCKSVLDSRLVKKLVKFCKQNPLEEECNQLLSTIHKIKKNNEIIDDSIQALVSLYKIENEKLDDFLNMLFELSMYMRGWKVSNDELPLSKHICNENSFHMEKIEEHINSRMSTLLQFIDNCESHIKHVIIKLPLIKLNETDKTFYRNTNADEGLTLVDRLKLIMSNTSVYSCIRMSSNFIASSYYYYDTLVLKKTKKFDIDSMDFIQ